MPRRARVQRRTILPDPIYGNVGVANRNQGRSKYGAKRAKGGAAKK